MSNDLCLQKEALDYLESLKKSFQVSKKGTAEEMRLQEIIDTTIARISKATKIDNTFLITLEKFYQSTSFMVGMTNLKLGDEAYQAWRAYDRFHYDKIKTQLHLYGNIVGPI